MGQVWRKTVPEGGGGRRGGGGRGATPPPGRAQCVAAGLPAPSRSFQPALAAGLGRRPKATAMRPLLLLAPLGWLLLAEAKGDAKPEGEGARPAAGGQGRRGG